MDLGVIVPTKCLSTLVKGNKYHLVLAHMVEQSKEYRDFYRAESDSGSYITLDNSSYEVGDGVYTVEQLLDFADMVGATEIMAPETYLDSEDTIRKVGEFSNLVHLRDEDVRIFGTLHGKTIDDLYKCHVKFLKFGVDTIGFSCRLDVEMHGRLRHPHVDMDRALCRVQVVNRLKELKTPKVRYHLLGLNHPYELTFYRDMDNLVSSNDSSCAYVHGREGVSIDDLSFTKSPSKINFSDCFLGDIEKKIVFHNIGVLRQLAW